MTNQNAPRSVVGADAILTLRTLARKTPPGAFVEVGVFRGGTAWHLAEIARAQSRKLHLFDTFTGIPERGPEDKQHKIGDFGDTSLQLVQTAIPDAIFHVGFFPDTMPAVWTDPVAFVHVDCDQYFSINAVIDKFWPLLVEGGIMLFDDYSATSGAQKAVPERFPGRFTVTDEGRAWVIKEAGQ